MILENAVKGLCVICSQQMVDHAKHVCKKCGKLCAIKHRDMPIDEDMTPGFRLLDVKSKCCNADVIISGTITDCEACHEILISEMELMHGKFKRVIDGATGIEHKVPLRLIIEHGLTQAELHKFPLWDGNNMQ